MRTALVGLTLALGLGGGACASTSPKDGFRDVAQLVERQSGSSRPSSRSTPQCRSRC